jgi:uncharacterized protein YuzE
MNINFDRVADAIYFSIGKGKVASTREVDDRLIVDLDKSGNVIGFELLDASTQLDKRGNDLEQIVMRGVPIQLTSGTPVSA